MPPLPPDELERLNALLECDVLDTLPERQYDDITRLAATICGTPIALITLVDRNRQWFKSRHGLEAVETPRDIAFCAHAILQDDLFLVADAADDERFRQNPLVTGEPAIRFYAGMPLIDPEGFHLGTLCVIDRAPKRLSADQRASLQILSRQVMALLQMHKQMVELRDARTSAKVSEERFRAFMDNGPAMAYMKDEEGRFVFVSEPLCVKFGIPQVGWLGKTDAELWGAEIAEPLMEIDRRVLASGELVKLVEVLPTADGTSSHWQSFKFPLLESSGRKLLAGMSVDVTAEKKAEEALRASEEKFRSVVERLAEGVVLLDPDTKAVIQVNRAVLSLVGYTAEEAVGLTVYDLFAHEAKAIDSEIGLAVRQGQTNLGHRQLRRRDGGLTDVDVGLSVAPHAGRNYLAVVLRDVSERRRYEERMALYQRELDGANSRLRSSSDAIPMAVNPAGRTDRTRGRIAAGFLLAATILICVGSFAFASIRSLIDSNVRVARAHDVRSILDATLAMVLDIQSSERGYLLTGKSEFLQPYHTAAARLPQSLDRLEGLLADSDQKRRLVRLRSELDDYMAHSDETIRTRRQLAAIPPLPAVEPESGRRELEEVRTAIAEMDVHEARLLDDRERNAERATRTTLATGGIGLAASFAVLVWVLLLVRREYVRRELAQVVLNDSHGKLEASLTELDHLTRETALIGTLSDYLQSCRTAQEAHHVLTRYLPELLPETTGSMGIINNSRSIVEIAFEWGGISPTEFAPDKCWALRRGRSHHSSGTYDPTCLHHAEPSPGSVCVPMVAHGETLGVLSVRSIRSSGTTEGQRRIARRVAEQASLALSNLRLQEALRVQSIRDPLTGLFNRRYLEATLEREVNRSRRNGQPLAVIILDVDHFKRFNDAHGHDGGDALLREFGRLISRNLRVDDIPCRYGGEEFCLILPGASSELARSRAELLRDALRTLTVSHNNGSLGSITMSAGVAVFPTDASGPTEAIAAADAALYRAKRNGRDRVEVAERTAIAATDARFDPTDLPLPDAALPLSPANS